MIPLTGQVHVKYGAPMPKKKKRRITKAERSKWGRKGGRVGGALRAAKLTPERRREIGKAAIEARWAKERARKEQDALAEAGQQQD